MYTYIVLRLGGRIPNYSRKQWNKLIRKVVMSYNKKRDPAQDVWGTYFKIKKIDKKIHGDQHYGFEVRSAGPDRKFYTKDDIHTTMWLRTW